MHRLFPALILSACAPAQVDLDPTLPAIDWAAVAPVVESHCVGCHAQGRLAGDRPMQTYDQAAPLAASIAAATAEARMPPWSQATTDWCPTPFHFRGDLRLDPQTVALFQEWYALGAPEGAGHAALVPPPEEVLAGANQELGLPVHAVEDDGVDDRLCVALDPGLDATGWLEGVAVEPGDARVLHHAGIRIVGADAGLVDGEVWECNGGAGVSADYVGTYAPGSGPSIAPPGSAMEVPAGAMIVVNPHYHAVTGETVTDASRVLLRWADAAPERVAVLQHWPDPPDLPLSAVLLPGPNDPAGPEILIPAGATRHRETVVGEISGAPGERFEVWQIASHMHLVGVEARIWAEHPDGSAQCLLHLPAWDFDWQRMYRFEPGTGPILPAGSRLFGQCIYDNTLDNPALVDSLAERGLAEPIDVHFGGETTDEMCMFMVGTVPPTP